jgi:hypothetical protein
MLEQPTAVDGLGMADQPLNQLPIATLQIRKPDHPITR